MYFPILGWIPAVFQGDRDKSEHLYFTWTRMNPKSPIIKELSAVWMLDLYYTCSLWFLFIKILNQLSSPTEQDNVPTTTKKCEWGTEGHLTKDTNTHNISFSSTWLKKKLGRRLAHLPEEEKRYHLISIDTGWHINTSYCLTPLGMHRWKKFSSN